MIVLVAGRGGWAFVGVGARHFEVGHGVIVWRNCGCTHIHLCILTEQLWINQSCVGKIDTTIIHRFISILALLQIVFVRHYRS